MKRFLISLLAGFVLAVAGCTAPPVGPDGKPVAVSPAQQSINALNTSYTALNAAIVSADAAVSAGVLKGDNARNARTAFVKTKEGLDAALLALKNAIAAAAAPK